MKPARSSSKEPVYLVPAVDKAFQILELLKSEGREMTISEMAHTTGWHKSSVHKLLVTLNHHGVVERDDASKRYTLGIALAEFGWVALNKLDIRHKAKPFLETLSDYSGETAVLAVLDGTKMVMVDKREPPVQIRASPFLGMRFPATTTSNGKVLLAWLPAERVAEIIRMEGLPARTKHSITNAATYLADLERTRSRGYAAEREEFHDGVSAVSAPVFNATHDVIATLSVVGPAFRMTEEKMRQYGKKCLEQATELSEELK